MTGYDANEIPCQVCAGRGEVYLEGFDGMPMEPIQCGYCRGSGTNEWVAQRRQVRRERNDKRSRKVLVWLIIATMVVFACHNYSWTSADSDFGPGFGIYLLMWIAVLSGWVWWWIHRTPRPSKHAPGFTTDHERFALGTFAAVVAARAAWDDHIKKSSHPDAHSGM